MEIIHFFPESFWGVESPRRKEGKDERSLIHISLIGLRSIKLTGLPMFTLIKHIPQGTRARGRRNGGWRRERRRKRGMGGGRRKCKERGKRRGKGTLKERSEEEEKCERWRIGRESMEAIL